MDRVAIFVDAGYLFAQGSVALSGKRLPRGSLALDHEKARQALLSFAGKAAGVPPLRVYWYDGTSTGPTPQHLTLAHLDGVKIRLGFVNSVGEQKGVDSLIVTDMIALAQNRAMSDAILLSGDEDLRVGVQQAQSFGVRVHLLGIRPSRGSQSLFLLQEADTCHEWGADELNPFLSVKPAVSATEVKGPPVPSRRMARPSSFVAKDPLQEVADLVAADVPAAELPALIEAIQKSGQTPRDLDRLLLAKSRTRLGSDLNSAQKTQVRSLFVHACQTRLKDPSSAQ